MRSERERLILLNLIPGIGSALLRRVLDRFGTLDALCAATAPELTRLAGLGPKLAGRIVEALGNGHGLADELKAAEQAGARIVTLADPDYPEPLKTISDPPLALYIKGTLVDADRLAVAVVGARHASRYGLACAERIAGALALHGVTIVSGLALGIDAAAHRGALNAGGRTLAVLGGGLRRLYPPDHEQLATQIAQRGALMSEYPMDTAPIGRNFPRRNRIISGLSQGVMVVEAGRRSGALITADCALEQGREVFAVPGPVTSATSEGTHALLKEGARLVTGVEDILEELGLPCKPLSVQGSGFGVQGNCPQPTAPNPEPTGMLEHATSLPERERRVLACLADDRPSLLDAIAAQSGLEVAAVSSLLVQLELKRLIQQLPGKQFVRKVKSAQG
jgi:DNA processing protein